MPVTPARRQTQFTELVQGPRASAADFGAAEAGALQGLGGTVGQLGDLAFQQARKQDKFVAQQAYNQSVEVAQNLAAEASALEGSNAIGAGTRIAKAMDSEVEKLTKGMSGRQKKMFDRNWSFRRNGYLTSIGKHEAAQTQKAFIGEQTTLLKAAQDDFRNTGNDAAFTAGLGALDDLMDAKGMTAAEKKQRRADYEKDMQTNRFDALVKVEDFDQAQELAATFTGAQKDLAEKALEGAKYSAMSRAESETKMRLTQGAARIMEVTAQQAPNDPYHVASFGDYNDAYDDPAIAIAEFTRRTEKVAALRAADTAEAAEAERRAILRERGEKSYERSETKFTAAEEARVAKAAEAAAVVKANNPATRRANLNTAYDEYFRASSGASTPDEVQAAIDVLARDTGYEAKIATGLLQASLNEMVLGKQDHVTMARMNVMAGEAKRFNESNNKNTFGWFRQSIPGDVDVEDGKIKSVNEASAYFSRYMSGFEPFLQMKASEKGKALTVKDIETYGDEYFNELRVWKTAEDIDTYVVEPMKRAAKGVPIYNKFMDMVEQMYQYNSSKTNPVPTEATGEQ